MSLPVMETTTIFPTTQCAQFVGVTKTFGKVEALRDVSFVINSGEVLVLLGRNGAGKTTIVRTLTGLTKPTKGTVAVFGGDPHSLRVRTRMGVQLQISQMPDTLRIREYIKLFSSYYPNPMPFNEVLVSARLEGLDRRLFKQLSGGEQQRLRFALAICGNPDFVILDEPTVGLDVETRHTLWNQIRSLASRKTTVLMTTHYLQEAEVLADRIMIIDEGKLVAEGTAQDLKGSVLEKRIRCTSALPLEVVLSMKHVKNAHREGARLEIQTDDTDLSIRELLHKDPELANIEIVSAGLEDYFLAKTSKGKLKGSANNVN
jgi:ABC-2 type transport system ATP-binding protein